MTLYVEHFLSTRRISSEQKNITKVSQKGFQKWAKNGPQMSPKLRSTWILIQGFPCIRIQVERLEKFRLSYVPVGSLFWVEKWKIQIQAVSEHPKFFESAKYKYIFGSMEVDGKKNPKIQPPDSSYQDVCRALGANRVHTGKIFQHFLWIFLKPIQIHFRDIIFGLV